MRNNGKVIGVEKVRICGTLVEIPLRLVREDNRYGARVTDFHYAVVLEKPAVIDVRHADPKECVKLAIAALEGALSITWEPVIAVTVEHGGDVESYGGGFGRVIGDCRLGLRVALFRRGTRKDGVVLFQEDVNGRLREVHPTDERVFIPDTPANRERIDAIVHGLARLGAQLTDLLSQGKIQKTLANVKVLALPAPKLELEPESSTGRRSVRPRKP